MLRLLDPCHVPPVDWGTTQSTRGGGVNNMMGIVRMDNRAPTFGRPYRYSGFRLVVRRKKSHATN